MRTRAASRLRRSMVPALPFWLALSIWAAPAPMTVARAAGDPAGGVAPDTFVATVPGGLADDPPSIAGRIGLLQGAAQSWDLRDNAWRDAVLNETIAVRAAVRTDPDARLEITVGASAFRLDRDTEIAWQRMDDDGIGLDLERGRLVVSRRQESTRPPAGAAWGADAGDCGYEAVPVDVRAGDARAVFAGPGVARLEHDEDGHRLSVSVLVGEAVLEHGGIRSPVRRGQMLSVDTRGGTVLMAGAAEQGAFDAWSFERDRRASARPSYRYVSPSMTGAEALDDHGRWDVHASWGPVWYPTVVAAGWAPYRDGRWVWTPGWGWTWVDAAPWGFAPFHYGRWVTIGSRWGWVPGRYARRPVYAPALVAFHGGLDVVRPGVAPRVGWFPLGPAEPWRPPYRHSPRYFDAVNRSHITVVLAPGSRAPARAALPPLRFARDPAATTMVDRARFARGPVLPARHRMGVDELARLPAPAWQAPVAMPRPLPVRPSPVSRPGPAIFVPPGSMPSRPGPAPRPQAGWDRPPAASVPALPPRPPVTAPREWRAPSPNPAVRVLPPAAPPVRGAPPAWQDDRSRPSRPVIQPPPSQAVRRPDPRVAPPSIQRRGPASIERPAPRRADHSAWRAAPAAAARIPPPAAAQAPRARPFADVQRARTVTSAARWHGRRPDTRLR